jgi:hypothetical protein
MDEGCEQLQQDASTHCRVSKLQTPSSIAQDNECMFQARFNQY